MASNYVFHNACVDQFNTLMSTHKKLIEAVCAELGQQERAAELCEKLLVSTYSRVKQQKDTNAPKRAKSAYILFCDDKRDELKEKFPENKMTENSKELGAMWKKLDKKARQAYILKSEADKERYAEEMSEYKRQTN